MVLTGREKATIFLSVLGAETASRVLRYLPNELAALIAAGINHLPTPSPEALSEVLDEYRSFLALPESEDGSRGALQSKHPQKTWNYNILAYERPQVNAFLLSLMDKEEAKNALRSISRDRQVVEELLANLKHNYLREKIAEKLKEQFAGKLF